MAPRWAIGRGRGAHAVIGDGVEIGDDSRLYPAVTIYAGSLIGRRVIIHAGARIGSDGFGYVQKDGAHLKIPHVGRCLIEDDVEIGANSTIDRGSIDDTVVGAGTKIDNLVQIAHNVRIGKLCLIMAQVGIAGSARVEDGAMLLGQVGVSGHHTIGAGLALLRRRVSLAIFLPVKRGPAIRRAPTKRRCGPRRRCSSFPASFAASSGCSMRTTDTKWIVARSLARCRSRGSGCTWGNRAACSSSPPRAGRHHLPAHGSRRRRRRFRRSPSTRCSPSVARSSARIRCPCTRWSTSSRPSRAADSTTSRFGWTRPEPPIMDGSAAPFVDALVSAGVAGATGRSAVPRAAQADDVRRRRVAIRGDALARTRAGRHDRLSASDDRRAALLVPPRAATRSPRRSVRRERSVSCARSTRSGRWGLFRARRSTTPSSSTTRRC